jgi:hypothetical protein
MVLERIARAFVAKKIRFREGVACKLKSPSIIALFRATLPRIGPALQSRCAEEIAVLLAFRLSPVALPAGDSVNESTILRVRREELLALPGHFLIMTTQARV